MARDGNFSTGQWLIYAVDFLKWYNFCLIIYKNYLYIMALKDYSKYPISTRTAHMLRDARAKSDILGGEISQAAVARMLDIQARTLRRIETDKGTQAPFPLIAALAGFYGIKMDDLVYDRIDNRVDVELEKAVHQLRHSLSSDQRAEVISDIRKQAKKNALDGDLVVRFGARREPNLK